MFVQNDSGCPNLFGAEQIGTGFIILFINTLESLMVDESCPKSTLKRPAYAKASVGRPVFEIEFLITLYRVAKGEWKIREVTLQEDSLTC
jgi:hypothetical protein